MQVLLNSDASVDGGHAMAEHLQTVVRDALARFGGRVTHVEAHVTDANGHQKAHPEEIHCTLEARLVGLDPVVAKDRAGNAHQAILGATGKLQRAISATLAKHEPRRHTAPLKELGLDASSDEYEEKNPSSKPL